MDAEDADLCPVAVSGATIIVGSGDSPLRPATPGTIRDWALAIERGVVQGDTSLVADPGRWIVVLEAAPPDAEIEADPALVAYEHVPEDSPALLAWRAGRNPLRARVPRDSWMLLAGQLAGHRGRP